MANIDSRVAKLERQVRGYRTALLAVVFGALALAGLGAARHPSETVRAHAVEVMDHDGNVVVRLGSHHRGSGYLEIRTREGNRVVSASALRGEGFIAAYSESGELLHSMPRPTVQRAP